MQCLTRELPWSLGMFLPEEVKSYLRPVRDRIKSIGTNRTSDETKSLESILAALFDNSFQKGIDKITPLIPQ